MTLNRRQLQIVEGLCRGLIYKEIAHELGLSWGTVKFYVCMARRSNQARTTEQLCALFTESRCLQAELKRHPVNTATGSECCAPPGTTENPPVSRPATTTDCVFDILQNRPFASR